MSRAAIATLSTENLHHNLSTIEQHAPGSKIIAMVKANAYGHGLRSVALRLENRVYSFGVASIDEAIALRKVGVKTPITLMEGVFEPDEYLVASCEHFHVVLHEETQLKWLLQTPLPLPLSIWIKIDTGMGRLGFYPKRAHEIYHLLMASNNIARPIGIMSHFGRADEPDHPLNAHQIEAFKELTTTLPGPRSFANSAALFCFPQANYEIIRPGLALYGVSPFNALSAQDLGLRPVMTLQTRLIAIRDMIKGSSIGYGGRFTCPEDMRVGVIAMGYGDGYPRTARDGTPILVNNVRCQVVGRVSMDMTTIDLRPCPQARVGDPVILWGHGLPIEEVAQYTSHIPYDILCGIQSRVKFQWTLNT